MNDLVLAAKAADWYKLKALVLDSVSSPITRRVYNMALDEFMAWFRLEPRPGFSKRPSAPGARHSKPASSVPGVVIEQLQQRIAAERNDSTPIKEKLAKL